MNTKAAATPQTDAVEGDLLAEYRYCEASFNGMAEHARSLEREKAVLLTAANCHADLVNVLKEARDEMQHHYGSSLCDCYEDPELLKRINAILDKAGTA